MNKENNKNKPFMSYILSDLFGKHPDFVVALNLYIKALKAKDDWKKIEINRKRLKLKKKSIEKITEWENRARNLYVLDRDRAVKIIKKLSPLVNKDDIQKLKIWLSISECSKIASNIGNISIHDGFDIIEARFAQLFYMYVTNKPYLDLTFK